MGGAKGERVMATERGTYRFLPEYLPECAARGDLAEAIIAVVERRHGATFVELEQELSEYFPDQLKGDKCLVAHFRPNVVAWVGMSDWYLETVRGLVNTRRLHFHPTSPLVYVWDGRVLHFPLAKRVPRRGYKEPHWLPVSLHLSPLGAT